MRAYNHLRGWRAIILVASAVITFLLAYSISRETVPALLASAAIMIPIGGAVLIAGIDIARVVDKQKGPEDSSHALPSEIDSLNLRVEVIDAVVSSETRRSLEPTTLPLTHLEKTKSKPILLLPGADYHLPEIMALAGELDRRHVPTVVAVGIPHWERTGDGLVWYDRDIYEAPTPEQVPEMFSAVVTMKDWAGYAPLVEAANDAGLPTFAKVEGAQDFHDVDTSSDRNPYRTARHILCQGQNDLTSLPEKNCSIVGSTRLERIWWAPPAKARQPLALINLNFTYGMMTDARDLWLSTAIEGCKRAGIEHVISVHPAEQSRNPHPLATSISASRLLRHTTILVSRFSTVPYEAMARGVPFVYHNPHGEGVPAFKDSMGAFETTTDGTSLSMAIRQSPHPGDDVRRAATAFFTQQVDLNSTLRSESRTAILVLGSNSVNSSNASIGNRQ